MPLLKCVDGEMVEMTPEEEAEFLATQQAESAPPDAPPLLPPEPEE